MAFASEDTTSRQENSSDQNAAQAASVCVVSRCNKCAFRGLGIGSDEGSIPTVFV